MGKRRTKAEMETIRTAICEAVERDHPMTVRQVFYRLAVSGVVPKQENRGYRTVQRLLVEMRRAGRVPYSWIVDSSRTVRRPQTFDSAEDALRTTLRTYRRDLWADAGTYIQVWLEKEALAGVLWDVTEEWQVSLWVNRGYSSVSYLRQGAESINKALRAGREVYVYNFGDHDPSGVNAWEKAEEDLREWIDAPERVRFERVAVTPEQIRDWDLPTRPTKTSDSRAEGFEGASVELDAIPPARLKELTRECIERHINPRALEQTKKTERLERETLRDFAKELA